MIFSGKIIAQSSLPKCLQWLITTATCLLQHPFISLPWFYNKYCIWVFTSQKHAAPKDSLLSLLLIRNNHFKRHQSNSLSDVLAFSQCFGLDLFLIYFLNGDCRIINICMTPTSNYHYHSNRGFIKANQRSYFENDWWICHWIIKCVLINVHNFSIKVQIENQILSSTNFLCQLII